MRELTKKASSHHIHTIKLYQKQVKVNVSYSSPGKIPKPSPDRHQPQIQQEVVGQTINLMTDTHQNRKKKKKKNVVKTSNSQNNFYLYSMKDNNNLIQEYEEFQQNLIDRVIHKRMKVYSKVQKYNQYQTPSKQRHVPTKMISLKAYQSKNIAISAKTKIEKQQTSSKKEYQVAPRSIVKIGKIKLHSINDRSQSKNKFQSPQGRRPHKIEVISASRRKKNDSLDKAVCQMSKQLKGTRLNTSTEKCSYTAGNSFNISIFH